MAAPVEQNSTSIEPGTVMAEQTTTNAGVNDRSAEQVPPKITDFLIEQRIVLDVDTSSRKRLFEHIAELSCIGVDDLDEDQVFKIIAERERLGSTGLGHGVAVPHGRIAELSSPVITLARLKHPVDYDAPDNKPVWLAVALLVPQDANATHLKLLSVLAGSFQNSDFLQSMKQCQTAAEVRQLFDQIA